MSAENFSRINGIKGELVLPGDKSISHRAVMFSSLAKGKSIIRNLSNSEDVLSTVKCFKQLGCGIEFNNDQWEVTGRGYKGFKQPSAPLDAGNSGTTARLISGILAAQNFETEIIGDDSLSLRPMKRIVEPLSLMGARISTSSTGTLPLRISPSEKFSPVTYELKTPSAQIKSSVLLAGLHLEGTTTVVETQQSRNHTEIMLNLPVRQENGKTEISVSKANYPESNEWFVPSDISSASFFIALTVLTNNSELLVRHVSLNESRTGFITILQEMGADIRIENIEKNNGEKYGNIRIFGGKDLKNIDIIPGIIPNIIDEIPVLSIMGLFAAGSFKIKGAGELRVKESDRIKALCSNFKMLGLSPDEYDDGFELQGAITNRQPEFESFHDHRIAMAFGVLSMLLPNGGAVKNFECVKISNPNFLKQLNLIAR